MLHFEDYVKTNVVYHVAPITQLHDILADGIRHNAGNSKYNKFNEFLDLYKPKYIPEWVSRRNAVYASMCFKQNHMWHSHSVLLSIRINESLCWIGNENLANQLYEPFILKDLLMFKEAERLMAQKGEYYVNKYWKSSLSFKENLKVRMDNTGGYDAEVLIMHDIPPCDINIIKVISDHKLLDVDEWTMLFKELAD